MTIAGTLALMATAIVAKIRPPPADVEITRLQARIDDLTRERDDWRSMAESWRHQAQRTGEFYTSWLQAPASQAQQAQLAAQGMQQQAAFCNCVPARQSLLLRG